MGQYTQQQIDAAIQDAQFAFWAEIVKHFPEVTTGDFPPDAEMRFDDNCTIALKTWLSCNGPEEQYINDILANDVNTGKDYSAGFPYETYVDQSNNPHGPWELSICCNDQYLNAYYYNTKEDAQHDANLFEETFVND